MPALDDYAPPLAPWLLVAAALAAAPAGLSVSRVVIEVARRSQGRMTRPATVARILAMMRDDGIADAHQLPHGGRLPSHIHTLTPIGRELFAAALAAITFSLRTTPHAQAKARTNSQHRRPHRCAGQCTAAAAVGGHRRL